MWVAVVSLLPMGVVAAHGCRSQVLPLLVGVTGAWCAWFLGCFGACCYKRRQSEGFFAENGGFLACIDDVCNRGPREAIGIALV